MTRETLQALSRKDLAELARKRGIANWHELKKDELVTESSPRSAPPTAQQASASDGQGFRHPRQIVAANTSTHNSAAPPLATANGSTSAEPVDR